MKLSLFFLYSIAGIASSTDLIGDQYGYLYTMTDLTSGTATPLSQQISGLKSIGKDTLTGKILIVGYDGPNMWVKEVCGGAIKDVALLPKGVELACVTGGPRGVFSLNKIDNSYGVLSNCGTYTKIGQLPSTFDYDDGYIFTQDDNGQIHVIDNQGNYYTQIAQCGWVKQATTFSPAHKQYCGYLKPDGTIYTTYDGGNGGQLSTLNLANGHVGTLDVAGVNGDYIVDLAVDVDTNRACTTCTPTAPTPTAPIVCPTTPTAPTIQTPTIVIAPTPTAPTKPTPTAPTKPTPTAPTSKGTKKGKKAPSPTSKGGKKTYASDGSMMTGLMNTTEFNLTLGYFN